MSIFKKKHNSQFLKDCDTDWNLNIEFIHWLRYWCKEYLKKASAVVNLEFHVIDGHTQKEAIEHLIDLCDEFLNLEDDNVRLYDVVDEIFDLFHKLFWYMWW